MLKGERIVLRQIESEAEYKDYLMRLNQLEHRAITDHTELVSIPKMLQAFHQGDLWTKDYGRLFIQVDDRLIGDLSFTRKSELEISIGYRMISLDHKRKGYMTEALKLFIKYLFDSIPLITRLSLLTAEDNLPSRKLAEKCGFSQEGVLRQAYFYRGKICNWILYSILREET